MSHRLHLDRIEAAAQTIDQVFLGTPQFNCEPLGDALGVALSLKIETLNPIRSFKGRGASWLVSRHSGAQPIVCASAGNFGQAMAYACRSRGISLTVFAATAANPLKVERMRQLGADVQLVGIDFDAAKEVARQSAHQRGARFVEDGADIETAEGAGTIGLEWLKSDAKFDALLIPLGNGALFNGVAFAVKSLRPGTRLIAVQAAGASAMIESWRAGRVIAHDRINTIADGIGVRQPIAAALDDMRELIDDALVVSDDSLLLAMRLVHRHVGLVVEPSGVAGIAALIEHSQRFAGQSVGTILCGGNLTTEQMRDWLASP